MDYRKIGCIILESAIYRTFQAMTAQTLLTCLTRLTLNNELQYYNQSCRRNGSGIDILLCSGHCAFLVRF